MNDSQSKRLDETLQVSIIRRKYDAGFKKSHIKPCLYKKTIKAYDFVVTKDTVGTYQQNSTEAPISR